MCLLQIRIGLHNYFVIAAFVLTLVCYALTEEWHHCNYGGVPVNYTTCSRQLQIPGVHRSDCLITHYLKNSSECRDLEIRSSIYNKGLGKVRLHSYYEKYVALGRNLVNASFTYIHWNYLRIQYVRRQNFLMNFCRAFNLSSVAEKSVNTSTELFYDCNWFGDTDFGDYEFDFKYEAFNSAEGAWEGRHYVFKLPKSRDPEKALLQNLELFMYLDVTDLPHLTVRWDPAPKHFGIEAYKINIFHKTNKSNELLDSEQVPTDSEELEHTFFVGSASGMIYVTVEVVHKNCSQEQQCSISTSPILKINRGNQTPLLIGIVGSVVLLPVFMYAFYIWRRYGLLANGSVPVVLIVYRQALGSHTKALIALAQYLRNCCQVQALLDELDIPLTESKDPFIWYQEAFVRADAVMVVSSPPFSNKGEGIYHNVDTMGLRLLAEKFSNPRCVQKLFSVLLPYCQVCDIPLEASNLRCFSLMKELNAMLWYIHHGSRSSPFSKLESYCFQSQMSGGTSDLRKNGKALLDALDGAKIDVESQKDNRSPELVKKPVSNIDFLLTDVKFVNSRCEITPFKDPLLPKPEPDSVGKNSYGEFPGNIDEMNLLGPEAVSSTERNTERSVSFMGFDINDLQLGGNV